MTQQPAGINNSSVRPRRLVTSALPYVNNIPHLGNLIQVLSADVYARFCRSMGYDTLYICGTDEYGTATETRAREESITPKQLCDRYFAEHKAIYEWFEISFDKFGRTTAPEQTRIVQDMFTQVRAAGFITSHEQKQLYSEKSSMFLADRYVRGTCPKCGYEEARGDQCENCGALLDSLDLINPVSAIDGTTPAVRETTHLYLNLPKLLPQLRAWMDSAKTHGFWAKNAVKMTEAWIRNGLRERAITRDLSWGIPVPLDEFSHKVFYVWFDAPIGYVSITASHTDEWETWWKNPDEVELVQFIGKDNIPFHTVLFPSTQLACEAAAKTVGTPYRWTKVHRVSSTEYLNYEGGMFSKSRGVGVFGNDAKDTGIPSDMWRFYMMYNRPETSDYTFMWDDFKESVNGQLINNLSNLCNRIFSFIRKNTDGGINAVDTNSPLASKVWSEVISREKTITRLMEHAELRKAYREIFMLSNFANKLFQDNEPWKLKNTDPARMRELLASLVYIIRDLAVITEPFTPHTARSIASQLGLRTVPSWQSIAAFDEHSFTTTSVHGIENPTLLFARLEDEQIAHLQERFSGSQKERDARAATHTANTSVKNNSTNTVIDKNAPASAKKFAARVRLTAAKIQAVENHPDAEKLYVIQLNDGSESGRTIVSGLRANYAIEDLVDKTIIVVSNLKKAKLRGVESNGMLLAASSEPVTEQEKAKLEVLFLPDTIAPGTVITPKEFANPSDTVETPTVKTDEFFSYELRVNNYEVQVHGAVVSTPDGAAVQTATIPSGTVG